MPTKKTVAKPKKATTKKSPAKKPATKKTTQSKVTVKKTVTDVLHNKKSTQKTTTPPIPKATVTPVPKVVPSPIQSSFESKNAHIPVEDPVLEKVPVQAPISVPKPASAPAPVAPTKPAVPEVFITRPPVVVVLGHVDHGKSSLLEAIKDFKITAKESGGITQHIGAYEVDHHGNSITFIDTPGHEAFSAMRARGAEVADIALLVVDSAQTVQPQTKEAIAAIRKAGIPMIVVLTKIDLPTADPERIKRELMNVDVIVESMAGDIPSVEVSAREKKGITELLEMILLVAEMQDLRSNISCQPEGLILESRMDSFKGPIAIAILEKGILRKRDILATGSALAKIKVLENFLGQPVEEVRPGSPAVILGFETVPGVGEVFKGYQNTEEAIAHIAKTHEHMAMHRASAEAVGDRKIAHLILKGDVGGSLGAIELMLAELPQDKVIVKVLKSEVGDINESDVKLAQSFGAHIIGFRVKINSGVMQIMKNDTQKKVRIKTFDIIYELIQEVRMGMEKSLEAETVRVEVGRMKALVLFFAEKNRQIIGGKITDGEIKRGAKLEVIRGDERIGSGRIINLQRDKKDMDVLKKGDECGILFEGNVKVERNDILVAYIEERQKGVL